MNVKNTKKPARRVEQSYEQRFKMQSYGVDNLYPQHLIDITAASGTAMLCLDRYAKFIEGYGFRNELTAAVEANRQGQTLDDILSLVAADVAQFGGFALHVNYDVLGNISDVHHIPFEWCRLEEKDDAGNVAHILVHPGWDGNATRSGKTLYVNERNIERFPVFAPDVAIEQMADAGGAANYNGQILWVSRDGLWQYPVPLYDSAITEISTDEGLSNVKYRNVRNNFLPACVMIAKRGIPRIDDDGNEEQREMISYEDLAAFQGDEKAGKILYIEMENDEDKPEIVPFPARNFDKDFTSTDESVVERIYAQFHQEVFYAIRIGKIGFSGDIVRDAFEYYAGEVTTEQRFIERIFERVFEKWHGGTITDFGIRPQRYMTTETTEAQNEGTFN